jgi:hypothetical protein
MGYKQEKKIHKKKPIEPETCGRKTKRRRSFSPSMEEKGKKLYKYVCFKNAMFMVMVMVVVMVPQ